MVNKELIIRELMAYKKINTKAEFARFLGIMPQTLHAWNKYETFNTQSLRLLVKKFPEVREAWISGGGGAMLKAKEDHTYYVNQAELGVPYYDLDFICGFDLVENDQSVNPSYHINFAEYNKADYWVNVTGQSMEPLIGNGDIIAIRKLEDWKNSLLFGEIYAIVTDEFRTVKRIRRSEKGDKYLRLIPINPDYDEQDIELKVVRYIYRILGCAKKTF